MPAFCDDYLKIVFLLIFLKVRISHFSIPFHFLSELSYSFLTALVHYMNLVLFVRKINSQCVFNVFPAAVEIIFPSFRNANIVIGLKNPSYFWLS